MNIKITYIPLILALTAGLSAKNKPNVIYILADDLGYGDLSCYGQTKIKTPNIDRLASEGIKFTNHYSGNTVSSPSRAVLLTGQPTGKCYLRGNPEGTAGERLAALDTSWTTLPELFKAAGYATGAYGKWGLGYTNTTDAQNPLMHGFDEFCGWKNQMIAHTYFPTSYVLNGTEIPLDGKTYVHDIIMNKAFQFIEKNAKEKKPFFCYIPTAIPHAAMHAPAELHEKWRKQFPEFDNVIGKYTAGPGEKCPPVQNPIAGFAAMMEHLDNQVGELLTMLKTLGVDDNTIIMFASDNGAHLEGGHDSKFWNSTGGLRGHKRDMHEGGIRTPMLARWPGVIKAKSVSNHISAFHDLVPTVADLLGQPVPKEAEGISFLPSLKSKMQKAHKAIYIEFHKGKKMFSQAVRMGKWKAYIEEGKWELYNLENDPFEKENIALQNPKVVEKIKVIVTKMKDDSLLKK